MKRAICISSIATIAAAVMIAQGPVSSRDAARSPASQPPPRTVIPQAYPSDQVRAGEPRFISQCGFCHGRDAAGGETGPDLTRSELVAEDARGDKIGPVVRLGRVAQGMPSFDLNDTELSAIVAYIHDRKTKAETLGGGRRSVDAADLATGNAEAGRRYFNGTGNCSGCHSATGDLAGIASRYQGLALLQRMLYPGGRAPAVSDKIAQALSAHFDQLGRYTDDDMHNVYAYLDTLK
jgi:cytochrome c oxidase cbb3-type subunit III